MEFNLQRRIISLFNSLKSPEHLSSLLFRNRWFLLPLLFIWSSTAILQLFFSQNEISHRLNSHWNPLLDVFFRNVTHLGDGRFSGFVTLLLLLFSFRKALLILLSYSVSGSITLLCKYVIFANTPRPSLVMAKSLHLLHVVPDVELLSVASFPSGHTTVAFSLFSLLAIFSSHTTTRLLCLLAGSLVGISRIYLLQHFAIDVQVGALLGVTSAFVSYFYMERYWHSHPKNWHNRGILNPQ